MNREIEAGIVPINEVLKVNPNIPKVTRDSRGLIRWKLQGNTPDQNEQLGITNVQGLFMERFPEFNELFLRGEDGKIPKDKRDEANEFISEKIGSARQFCSQINSTLNSTKKVPYFEGSHLVAIRKSFAPWGIDLSKLSVDPLQGNNWVTMRNLRYRYGIQAITIRSLLEGVTSMKGRAKTRQTTILYKNSEAVEKITRFNALPKIIQDVYIDENGRRWIGADNLAKIIGYNTTSIYKLLYKLDGIPTMQGRSKKNKVIILFDEERVLQELEKSGFFKRREQAQSISPEKANEELMKFLKV